MSPPFANVTTNEKANTAIASRSILLCKGEFVRLQFECLDACMNIDSQILV